MDPFMAFLVIGGLMVAFVGVLAVVSILGTFVPTKWVPCESHKLTSLQVSDSISGVFVWGSGSVSGRMIYRSMLIGDDGTLRPYMHDVDNENTTLKQDADLQNEGRLTVLHEVAERTAWWMKLAVVDCTHRLRYAYVVPKGTVRNQFTVN